MTAKMSQLSPFLLILFILGTQGEHHFQCKFSTDIKFNSGFSNLKVVLACGQYRCRDCRNLELFLHCSTQPVIESSTKIRTSPLILDFDGIETILEKMKISKFNNLWSKVSFDEKIMILNQPLILEGSRLWSSWR